MAILRIFPRSTSTFYIIIFLRQLAALGVAEFRFIETPFIVLKDRYFPAGVAFLQR